MKKKWITRKDHDGLPDRVDGTKWMDFFSGENRGDFYFGRAGDDEIYGNGGGDRLLGGSGNDNIYGVYGSDRLFGGPGNDHLVGGEQKDIVTGGTGADVFRFLAFPASGGVSHLDIITDFDTREANEYIWLTLDPAVGITEFSQLRDMMVQDGDDVVLSFGGVDLLVLENVRIRQLIEDDFFIQQFEDEEFYPL